MSVRLKDCITLDCVKLGLNMTVENACQTLTGRAGALGAIFDEDRPVTLVVLEDLEKYRGAPTTLVALLADLPPGIVAPSDITVEEFATTGAYAAFNLGARGALLFEGEQMLGAVTAQGIDIPLREGLRPFPYTRSAQDAGLAGRIIQPKLVIYCHEFKHRNELAYYNRRKPPDCQVSTPYPHPIHRV
jgi:hypothetical protein